MNHPTEEQFVLYYYGESTAEAAAAGEHLGVCEECRATYQSLQRVLNSVDSLPVPERASDFEQRVWASIEHRIERKRRFRWLAWRPLAAAAAMAVLIVAAFLAGQSWRKPKAIIEAGNNDPAAVRERVLLVAVGDHLERSQMVLVELANAGEPASGRLNISNEQMAAKDLLESNRLFRQTASTSGDVATADLLDDLERVLLDIAHSPSEVNGRQLEELRHQIEDRGILFKVKVFGSQVERSANNVNSL